jgi:predicted outer membrane repeat protein
MARYAGICIALLTGLLSLGAVIGADASRASAAPAAGVVGDGTPGSCTEAALRSSLSGGGSVTFNCGPAPVTISLASVITITQPTTILGAGLISLDGGNATRLFFVHHDASLTLQAITLRRGWGGSGHGGAIVNHGALVLQSAAVLDSQADFERLGGAIYTSGPMTITGSTLANNSAGSAGAMYIVSGELLGGLAGPRVVIVDSVLRENSTYNYNTGYGGAIWLGPQAELVVQGGGFYTNTARFGGAVYMSPMARASLAPGASGPVLAGNQAESSGGAIYHEQPGTLSIDGGLLRHNTSQGSSGAIYAGDVLSLTNTTLHGNSAVTFGGGAIYADGPAYLAGVQIYSNTASTYAGGAGLFGGPVVLRDVAVYGNSTTRPSAQGGGDGGGLVIDYATTASLENVRIYSNTIAGGVGAGLAIWSAAVSLTHSAVYSNAILEGADARGGGIFADFGAVLHIANSAIYANQAPTGRGGGLFIERYLGPSDTQAALTNVTLSGNLAQAGGGLMQASSLPVTLTHVTAVSNTAAAGGNISGSVALRASLLAFGSPDNCFNPAASLGYNLEDAGSCGLAAAGDKPSTAANIGPLAVNGSPLPHLLTHALLPGSPAINAVPAAGCPATDQRGVPRPAGPACDTGAFELLLRLYLPLVRR